jgi:hypothetical protein
MLKCIIYLISIQLPQLLKLTRKALKSGASVTATKAISHLLPINVKSSNLVEKDNSWPITL